MSECEGFYQREISIPLYPSISEEDVNYIIEAVSAIFEEIN